MHTNNGTIISYVMGKVQSLKSTTANGFSQVNLLAEKRELRRHQIADRKRETDKQHLIQPITTAYCLFLFSERREAKRL